jgi:hypothetical protein
MKDPEILCGNSYLKNIQLPLISHKKKHAAWSQSRFQFDSNTVITKARHVKFGMTDHKRIHNFCMTHSLLRLTALK